MTDRMIKQGVLFFSVALFLFAYFITGNYFHYAYEFDVDNHLVHSKTANSPIFEATYISPHGLENFIHAASITELSNGQLRAVWYGGSRDGSKDTKIYTALYHKQNKTWEQPEHLMSREQAEQELNIPVKKLSNPIIWQDRSGKTWFLYVSISVGGLMFSSLNVKMSTDNGKTWSKSKRIMTSPFLNYSTLVKGTPFHLTQGQIAVPIYHQFANKFAELLILNTKGDVIDKRRLSKGREAIQPVIVPISSKNAWVMMRDANDEEPNQIVITSSNNGGETWKKTSFAQLANPNAAVSAVPWHQNKALIAFNNQAQERNNLSIAINTDKHLKDWDIFASIEDDAEGYYAYPYMIQDSSGVFHLVYTWNKTRIKHVRFNNAWVFQNNRKQTNAQSG